MSVKDMKLVIATPFYEMKGWSPYIYSLALTMWFLSKHTPVDVQFWPLDGDSYVERARNTLVYMFLDSDRTDLLFIDSDMQWNIDGITRLIGHDVDIVGAGYPCKNSWDFFGCVLQGDDRTKPIVQENGLIRAWGVPTGFMKIKRRVFEKLIEVQPDNFYMTTYPKDPIERKVYNFFGRRPPMGEDISFCRRWAEAGGDLWIEPNITLAHYGVQSWDGNFAKYLQERGFPDKMAKEST